MCLRHLNASRIQLVEFGACGCACFINMGLDARENIFGDALAGLFDAVQYIGLSKTGLQLFRFLPVAREIEITSPSKVIRSRGRAGPHALDKNRVLRS